MSNQIKSLIAVICILSVSSMVLTVFSGCSSSDTRKQAEKMQSTAEASGDLAAKVMQILEDYPADSVEDSVIADMVRSAVASFNSDWSVYIDQALLYAVDIRSGAIAFVNQIPDLQANLYERAAELNDQADKESNGFENALNIGIQYGLAIFGTGGIAGGILGVFNAVRSREAAVSIVKSVDAVRSYAPEVNAAYLGSAGNVARYQLTPTAAKLVAAHKLKR